MATIVIDLYDIGVRVCNDSQIIKDSEGYALIESDQSIITGESAKQYARLRPREISTQFWGDLSSNSNTKMVVSNAELAYWHLHSIWTNIPRDDYEVIITTPNTLSKQDLGLLLGICEKLSINVVAIVSNAVLALSSPIPNCKTVYLDLLQHRIALTEIAFNSNNLEVNTPNKIIGYGLNTLINNLAESIAKIFISETRFDPMHLASDEQQFFDKLPLWLNVLEKSNSVECSLSADTGTYTITLKKETLISANQKEFNDIANYINMLFHNEDTVAIVCSPSCSRVFGLLDFLKSLPGCAIIFKEKLDLAKNALQNEPKIRTSNNQIHYTTSIEYCVSSVAPKVEFNTGTLSRIIDSPSHVLIDNQAYPLHKDLYLAKKNNKNDFFIQFYEDSNAVCKILSKGMSVEVKKLNNSLITINNEPLNHETAVRVGDRLSINDNPLVINFIRVHENEATYD